MRINLYAEELTDRFECITKIAEGRKFYGLRFFLKTVPEMMPPIHQDDDQSAVTFWFLSHDERREYIDKAQTVATLGLGMDFSK